MISSLIMVSFPWTHQLQLGESDTSYKVASSAFAPWEVEEGQESRGRSDKAVCALYSLSKYLGIYIHLIDSHLLSTY